MICVKNKNNPDFLVAWEQKLSTRGHQALQEHSHEPELPWFYFFQQKISNNHLLHFLQVITHILFFTLVYFIGVAERISATMLFYRSWNCKSSHNATWYIAVSSCLKFTFTIEAFDFLRYFCPFFPCRCFGNFMLLIQTCFAILSIILEKTSRQGGIRKNIIVLKCKNKVYLCWSPIFFCRIFERTVLGMMKQDWSVYIWLCKFI